MKKYIIILLAICFSMGAGAQGIYNDGARIVNDGSGSYWVVDNGSFTLTSASATNPAHIDHLKIMDDASLTIGSSSSPSFLTVNQNLIVNTGGSLLIKSGVDGTGSLIVNGTATGNVTVERFLSADKWHYIAGQADISDNFSTTMGLGTPGSSSNSFYRWDESALTNGTPGTWIDILNGPTGNGVDNEMDESFVACRGYAVTYATTNKTLSLSGVPYIADKSIAITKTDGSTNPGANLVGNPFCSDIAITTGAQTTNNFIDQNSSVLHDNAQAVYFWDESQDDYEAKNNVGEVYADPGQGFMVIAKNATGTLSFNKNIRKHGAATFYKSNDSKTLELLITDSENRNNKTTIAFLPGMTIGLDPSYDAMKLKGNPAIALYTRLVDDNGKDFAIQALPDQNIEDYIIPIGVDVSESGVFEFSAIQENLENYSLLLEDRQENTFTNLRWDTYFATISESGTGRFYLHFKDATAVGEITHETNISFNFMDGKIKIQNPGGEKGIINLVNISGQILKRIELSGNDRQEFSTNQAGGIYIINIKTDATTMSWKLFLK